MYKAVLVCLFVVVFGFAHGSPMRSAARSADVMGPRQVEVEAERVSECMYVGYVCM